MPTTPTKLNSRSGGGSDEVSDLGRQKRNGAYYVVCISTVVLLGFIAEKEICVKSLAAICKAFFVGDDKIERSNFNKYCQYPNYCFKI